MASSACRRAAERWHHADVDVANVAYNLRSCCWTSNNSNCRVLSAATVAGSFSNPDGGGGGWHGCLVHTVASTRQCAQQGVL
eukprot:1681909-Rhodomonas_salina.1